VTTDATNHAHAVPIALIGMGRMGRTLAALAAERGMPVVATLDHGDAIGRDTLNGAAVAVEFTEPGGGRRQRARLPRCRLPGGRRHHGAGSTRCPPSPARRVRARAACSGRRTSRSG
jgi:hypothetical protein